MMKYFTRREAIKAGAASAGLALSPLFAEEKKFNANDVVELGKTGIKTSRLAMGTGMKGGNRQSRHTRMGQEKFTKLIRHGIDRGLAFLDLADWYGTHDFAKKALTGVDREKYILETKLWTRNTPGFTPSGGAIKEIDRFRKELNSDYIDVCIIHYITYTDYVERHQRVRDELDELKEKGIVKAVGASFHHPYGLLRAAEDPWIDVIFARINHLGGAKYKMDGPSNEIAKILKLARKNGKAVVGMKIYGEGTIKDSNEMNKSLEFVLKNDLTDAMTIGMERPEEIDDNFARIEKV
jgi:1-deoxyxylulose-5-phosphate synthase